MTDQLCGHVFRAWLHIALISLILLNGMGYTLIQAHFYLDREQITAIYCINKDKPQLECDGKCELSKRLSEAKNKKENEAEVTLEELSLTFFAQNPFEKSETNPRLDYLVVNTPKHQISHQLNLGKDFFHPPQT